MGNQLVGVAPSQIFPVEHYLTDHPQLQFDVNLGSTRFFKVARAKSQEGLIVVKVFAIHDPTLPLVAHRKHIEDIRARLSSAVNCLPFQKTILQDKAGFIIREYVKSSLYDRISTRPFLTATQRKFIAFQLLYALHQCHKVGVCHGDIKLENVMVTSWNWILLTDFASFKPSLIPEDNPADFSYFFDTSRRRICYIAPERFHSSVRLGTESVLLEEETMKGELTPAMDIFSVGCCLIELYNEGQPPFDLSQLLAYRMNYYYPQKHLDNIEDEKIRSLLAHMIQKDPQQRHSAEVYLDEAKGSIFPEYFYSFLQSYMLMFSVAQPVMSADEKIIRLSNDVCNVIEMLCGEAQNKEGKEGLVIITTLVTSCIRALRQTSSKLLALRTLMQLSRHSSAENILDRITPYVLHLVHDSSPRVRMRAVSTLTQILELVKPVPPSDANIFPEYILPGLVPLVHDPVVLVRCAYAAHLADIAQTALRFIEECQREPGSYVDVKPRSYETELEILQDMIQQSSTSLLTESANVVKITLMKKAITRLCVLFGKQKANDIILSHLITFLNDKKDKNLRGAFFDCIVGVVSYVGLHASSIITPLLQQGLTDPEEFIVVKAINAMKELILLRLLTKPCVYLLVSDCVCYLTHPNLWIRHAVAGLIAAVAKTLDPIDVQCRLSSTVRKSLSHPLRSIDKEYLVLNALVPPLSRTVYDVVIKCPDIDLLLNTLKEKQKARDLLRSSHVVQYISVPSQLKTVFRKLESEGLDEGAQDLILMMSKHLLKIHQHRQTYLHSNNKNMDLYETNGRIELTQLNLTVPTHVAILKPDNRDNTDVAKRKMEKSPDGNMAMNQEWQHMFSSAQSDQSSRAVVSAEVPIAQPSADPEQSLQDKSYVQYRRATCRLELRDLIARKQEAYHLSARGREWAEQAAWKSPLPPPGWRCRGTLVAHLHEHRGAVTKIVPMADKGKFASCSNDGFIRLWDCAKMEGRNIVNRSRLVYNKSMGALLGMTLCEGGESLAVASSNGSISVLRMEASSARTTVQQVRQLDGQEDGCAVDINYLDSGLQSVLVYATMFGSLVGWDLRKPGIAWKLDNDLKHGVITSFCVDSEQCWACVGTSSGYHTAWDLRFLLPIANCIHPHGSRVWKIVRHPTERSCILSSVQGNHEVSVWNLETQSRQAVLWGSTTPPLSNTQQNGHSACSLFAGRIDRNPFLFTGGSDMRLRYWDLATPMQSHLVVRSALDTPLSSSIAYDCRIIDGMNVVHEMALKPRSGTVTEEQPRSEDMKKFPADEGRGRAAEAPNPGHNDAITDIEMCQANQCFLITASRNGIIKVWK